MEHWQKKEEQGSEVMGPLQTDTQILRSESGFSQCKFCLGYQKRKENQFSMAMYNQAKFPETGFSQYKFCLGYQKKKNQFSMAIYNQAKFLNPNLLLFVSSAE